MRKQIVCLLGVGYLFYPLIPAGFCEKIGGIPAKPSMVVGGEPGSLQFDNNGKKYHWGGMRGFAVADFNGDGRMDIAVINHDALDKKDAVFIFHQKTASPLFSFPPDLVLDKEGKTKQLGNGKIHGIAAGDLDRNGLDDLVVIGAPSEPHRHPWYIFYQDRKKFPRFPTEILFSYNDIRIPLLMDLTNNGLLDIVGLYPPWHDIIQFQRYEGSFRGGGAAKVAPKGIGYCQGNLNKAKDSFPDMAVPAGRDGIKIVFHPVDRNNTGRIEETDMIIPCPADAAGAGIGLLRIGDLNGDGRDDIIAYNPSGGLEYDGSIYLYCQLPREPYFSTKPDMRISGLRGARSGVVGDLDGDKKADIVVSDSHWASNKFWVFYAKDGFKDKTATEAGLLGKGRFCHGSGSGYGIGDFNNDGLNDLIQIQPSYDKHPRGICIYLSEASGE